MIFSVKVRVLLLQVFGGDSESECEENDRECYRIRSQCFLRICDNRVGELSHSQFPIPLSHYPSKRQINPRARDFFRFRQLVLPVALRLSLHHQ